MSSHRTAEGLRITPLPILMVTAKSCLPEVQRKGFIVGTDDYHDTKPVDEEEMVLRIRALLRRAQIVHERTHYHRRCVTLDYTTPCP